MRNISILPRYAAGSHLGCRFKHLIMAGVKFEFSLGKIQGLKEKKDLKKEFPEMIHMI
jgi:hypothetical protein